MKKVFEFRRNDSAKGRRLRVSVTLTDDNCFSCCCEGPTIYHGQCLDKAQTELNIKDPILTDIVRLWKLYHLNDMKAGDREQEKAVKEYRKNHEFDYKKVCEYLDSIGLLVHDGYKYGTAWKKEEIPADDLAIIKKLLEI